MDYEKAYKEALRKAKETLEKSPAKDVARTVIEHFFPELRESEDERTRKEILKALRGISTGLQYAIFLTEGKKQRWIAWLEKQKDKMTTEEYEQSDLFKLKLRTKYCNGYQDGIAQKEQKPAEWSEEDEMYLSQAIETLEHENYSILADKLKSLRNRPKSPDNWKPSEEQMKALNAISCHGELTYTNQGQILIDLYNDLKKL